MTAREIRQFLFLIEDQDTTVKELRLAMFELKNQDEDADLRKMAHTTDSLLIWNKK